MSAEDRRRDLRDMVDDLDKYFEELENDIQKMMRADFLEGRGPMKPFVAGFSLRLGPEGKPTIQYFGDSPQSEEGFRAPMTEQVVDAKSGTLRVVADVPGVEKSDIEISATEQAVTLQAARENRRYRVVVPLKAEVEPESAKAEYRNGILQISFSLKDKSNKAARRVRVD